MILLKSRLQTRTNPEHRVSECTKQIPECSLVCPDANSTHRHTEMSNSLPIANCHPLSSGCPKKWFKYHLLGFLSHNISIISQPLPVSSPQLTNNILTPASALTLISSQAEVCP